MMNNLKKLFVLVLVVAVASLGMIACSNKSEPTSDDHPSVEQSSDEHPSGEHPSGEQSSDEHPSSEHPK